PVPAQSTLASSGEGASAVTDPSARSGGLKPAAYLPAFAGISHLSPRVRSPLIAVQLWPPFVVFQTPAVAKKSTLGSFGDQMIGWVRTVRAGGSLGAAADDVEAPRPPLPPRPPPRVMFAFCVVRRL